VLTCARLPRYLHRVERGETPSTKVSSKGVALLDVFPAEPSCDPFPYPIREVPLLFRISPFLSPICSSCFSNCILASCFCVASIPTFRSFSTLTRGHWCPAEPNGSHQLPYSSCQSPISFTTPVSPLSSPENQHHIPKMASNGVDVPGEKINTDIVTLTRFLTEEQTKHKEATGDFTFVPSRLLVIPKLTFLQTTLPRPPILLQIHRVLHPTSHPNKPHWTCWIKQYNG
jgi:hypothetical protein